MTAMIDLFQQSSYRGLLKLYQGGLMLSTILVVIFFILVVRVVLSFILVGVEVCKNKNQKKAEKDNNKKADEKKKAENDKKQKDDKNKKKVDENGFAGLNYEDHKDDIVKKIDEFYHDSRKVDELLKNKKLLYRKAELTNLLEERTTLRDAGIDLVIAFSCALASYFLEADALMEEVKKIFSCDCTGWVIGVLLVGSLLYVIIQNGMEVVKTEAYRYELEYISKAIESHMDTSLVPDEVMTVEIRENSDGSVVKTTTKRTVRHY